MRSDMDKLLTEHPRANHSAPNVHVIKERAYVTCNRKDPESLEDMPKTDPMKRFDWGWGKEFGESLNPLRKFLLSKVGAKWDDVYSEIREHLDPKSTIQNHIMQHLWHYVERNVTIDEDGRPYYLSYNGWQPLYRSKYRGTLYVHPLTGILLESPPYPKKPDRMPWGYDPNKYKAPDGTDFIRKNGVWFKLVSSFVKWDYEYETKGFWLDTGVHRTMQCPIEGTWAKRFEYKEQQCSKKELKKYGLKNEVPNS